MEPVEHKAALEFVAVGERGDLRICVYKESM
jgi:hypothetical protein